MSSSWAISLAGMIPPFVIPNIMSYFLCEVFILAATIWVSSPISPQLLYSLGELFSFISSFLNFKNYILLTKPTTTILRIRISYLYLYHKHFKGIEISRGLHKKVCNSSVLNEYISSSSMQLSLEIPILFN